MSTTESNALLGATGRSPNASTSSAQRVLVAVDGAGNRREIERILGQRYQLVAPDDATIRRGAFDLAVCDGPGLHRYSEALTKARSRERPVFLPVMLILPRANLRDRVGGLLDLVDDFITTPIDRNEFLERVQLLLRAREQARAQREELVRIVNFDAATGLPRRHVFSEWVASAMQSADSHNLAVAVLVIDIPLAKVLQTVGEHGIEEAAVTCTNRLHEALPDDACLARAGDQQWGARLLLDNPLPQVVQAHDRIRRLGEIPVTAEGESLHVSPRVGVAQYPGDATSASRLIDAATAASSRADTDTPTFYDDGLRTAALRYMRTETGLHDALANNQFELWLQPKIALQDGLADAAEALIRWRRPDGQLVPPGEFIPVAEASGFIRRITYWVLTTAVRTLADWRSATGPACTIAVNVTPTDIQHPSFFRWLTGLCRDHDVPTNALELELTETMFCDMGEATIGCLQALRDAGFTIAIDDFGTGYSSLGYLHQLPAHTLKIDKSFIDHLPGDVSGESVVRAIINLAHEFGLGVVAEGIETQAQLEHLRAAGANHAQGYWIARPMPIPEFQNWLTVRPTAIPTRPPR